jgi:nucleotide-binding universal stress UspA family protein
MASMTVVAGVDGSAESMRAAEWGARGAKRHRAPMRLVSAAATPPSTHERGGLSRAVADELRGESVRALRDAVARMEEDLPRLPVSAGLLTGPPALGVTASGSRALMLVVGARGAGGFAAMRSAGCPPLPGGPPTPNCSRLTRTAASRRRWRPGGTSIPMCP